LDSPGCSRRSRGQLGGMEEWVKNPGNTKLVWCYTSPSPIRRPPPVGSEPASGTINRHITASTLSHSAARGGLVVDFGGRRNGYGPLQHQQNLGVDKSLSPNPFARRVGSEPASGTINHHITASPWSRLAASGEAGVDFGGRRNGYGPLQHQPNLGVTGVQTQSCGSAPSPPPVPSVITLPRMLAADDDGGERANTRPCRHQHHHHPHYPSHHHHHHHHHIITIPLHYSSSSSSPASITRAPCPARLLDAVTEWTCGEDLGSTNPSLAYQESGPARPCPGVDYVPTSTGQGETRCSPSAAASLSIIVIVSTLSRV
jgi:hypothetical protein